MLINGIKKIVVWLDHHGLFALSIFLLAFIPLFPKIPLFDAIPGYLVRVRVEDLLVFLTGVLWLIQALRGKIIWRTIFFWGVVIYLTVGLLSLLAGIFLITSIPAELLHIGKSALHFFRYGEYFALFFFTLAAIQSKRQLQLAMGVLVAVIFAVAVYGYGQIHWHWPLFSTMSRESSKGMVLYLSEFARVQSTFAGHYDLSAFVVLTAPLFMALILNQSYRQKINWLVAGVLVLALGAGFWLLIASASKTALLAYLVGAGVVAGLSVLRKPRLKRFSLIVSGIAVGVMGVTTILAMSILRMQTAELLAKTYQLPRVQQSRTLLELNNFALGLVAPADQLTSFKPKDVYVDVPDYVKVATVSATGEPDFVIEERDRTWSDNALKYGLSMGIRLDTLWPQAIRGFIIDPFTGKGYGTLSKEGYQEFIEADSTDNNFLRILGETGLLGLVSFFGLLWLIMKTVGQLVKTEDNFYRSLSIGFLGGSAALLTNAVIIDVFVASKVAFTFWALAGMAVKAWFLHQPQLAKQQDQQRQQRLFSFGRKHWPIIIGALLLSLTIHKHPFSEVSVVKSLAHAPHQVASVKMARCVSQSWDWSACQSTLIADQSFSPLYVVALIPWYLISSEIGIFFYLNLLLGFGSLVLVYLLANRFLAQRWQVGFVMLIYAFLPMVYRYPATALSANLSLFLGLLLVWVGLRSAQSKIRGAFSNKRGWLAVVAILFILSLNQFNQTILLLIAPVLAIGSVYLLTKLASAKWQLAVGLTAGVLLILTLVFQYPQQALRYVKSNYSDRHPAYQFTTVREANIYLTAQAQRLKLPAENDQLHFASDLHPDYVSLFGEKTYQLHPLDRDLSYYQPLLTNNNQLYISNLADDRQTAQTFADFHQQLQLQLVRINCGHQCNLYRVFPETLPFRTQPRTLLAEYNEARPATVIEPVGAEQLITDTDQFRFTVLSHQFLPLPDEATQLPEGISPETLYNGLHFAERLTNIYHSQQINQMPPSQLTFLMGDVLGPQDGARKYYLMSQIAQATTQPTIFAQGNYELQSKKHFNPGYQSFQLGSNYFLVLDPARKGELTSQQEIFVHNEILKLEKHPEIEHIFVFAPRPSWLLAEADQTPTDRFFNEFLYPTLTKFEQAEVTVFSGGIEPNSANHDMPAKAVPLIYQPLPNSNLTFIAVNTTPTSATIYLDVQVDGAEVKITPLSLEGQLAPLESFSNPL